MDELTKRLLWKEARSQGASKKEWSELVDSLLSEFSQFVSEDFERDPGVMIDLEGRNFSAWIWSPDIAKGEFEPLWSGVMAGSAVSNTEMAVSISIFIFDAATHARLAAEGIGSYLLYTAKLSDHSKLCWERHGWTKDEFGEWADVAYSEP